MYCTVSGCGRIVKAKSLCDTHYAQKRRCGVITTAFRTRWTCKDVEQLKQWYEDHKGWLDVESLAKKLNRSVDAIHLKASKLGIGNKHRRWHVPKRKYGNKEAFVLQLPRLSRERIAKYGHPRGFAGRTHSEESKKKIAIAAKRYQASRTQSDRINTWNKVVATMMRKYGVVSLPAKQGRNTYSRCNGGKRSDLGGRYFRSSWEANYARYLELLKQCGEIAAWEYESDTFVFSGIRRGTCSYTPDFKVTENNGKIVFHEIKGWMDAKSKTRLKRMAKYHPDIQILLIGEKEYKAIARTAKPLISNWE